MKAGCQGVSVMMPTETVVALSRLKPYNRTRHINNAVATYLEIQGPARNRYGVDCAYFRGKLALIQRDIGDYTPEELNRSLRDLARTAIGMGAVNESV